MAHRNLIASKNLDVAVKRLMTQKVAPSRASSVNWPQPPTYLVYALVQHSPISSLSIVGSGATVLAAPSTSRSRKPPTSLRRSSLQN